MKTYIIAAICLATAVQTQAQATYNLSQCTQMAFENNIEMKKADIGIQQAELQRKEVFTKFFPSVSAGGLAFKANKDLVSHDFDLTKNLPSNLVTSFRQEFPNLDRYTTFSMGLLDHFYVGSIQAIQPVFLGGRLFNGYKLTKLGVEAGNVKKEMSEQQVEKKTAEYYWQLVQLKEKVNTINALQERLDNALRVVQTAVKAGVKERNDLLMVQLRQNQLEKGKIQLENGINLAKRALAQYMGLKTTDFDIATENIDSVSGEIFSLKEDHDAAVINTPEYRLLEMQVEQKRLERKIAVGDNLPTVGVGALASAGKADAFDVKANAFVFAVVNVPISKWWGGSHSIKSKKLGEQLAQDELTDNTELLKLRMQKTWDEVVSASKQLAVSKKSIEQSKENLRLNRAYYKAGTGTMTDLLEAQQLYQQAKDDYVKDYTDLQMKILEYKQATGLSVSAGEPAN